MATTGKITKAQRERKERDDVVTVGIRAQVATYFPGRWAGEVAYGPACCCGVHAFKWPAAGGGIPSGICHRHPWAHLFVRADSLG
jgi:hypothetical protein